MQISNHANKPQNISFKTTGRQVEDSHGNYAYSNYTFFFRNDMNWDKFSDYIIDKYKDQDKVNVYCNACSDGSEPYSLAMILIAKLGEEGAQKFFPIHAKDKDDFHIASAQDGEVGLSTMDLSAIKQNTGKSALEFLTVDKNTRTGNIFAKFKNNIKDAVEFEQGDILDEIEHIDPDNSIVLFRNAWPYLGHSQATELSKKIGENLGENSMLVIGNFDLRESSVTKLLYEAGLNRVQTDRFIAYQQPTFKGKSDLNQSQYLFNVFAKKY